MLVEKFQKRPSEIEALNDTPLYPAEQVLLTLNPMLHFRVDTRKHTRKPTRS